ncbi:MAG: 6-carboxytetrahydropterin synthase [Chitinophagales bacterium]|nr:6-carboxytetrahydropterin synthase [Chitinophagales bacterium]HAE14078.1 6-pyruvoyl tetrahydrobiopterin synthase [Bacteroidota bacterium]MCB9021068.1 6-carboxytetrahydropterin synthase [Chitinophagales bacterium]HAE35170.1 6-pyruvoyl tetrahydrobiopterin synthase [Bacteroidota bacterium]HPE98156.1 6-carboxytetrahydropterin synthase [Chitinophagales bacterium]
MRTAVIRRVTFNAAHRLFRADWSEERNREVFGLCSNPNYHGHNYTLFVRVTGDIDPETGYVLDLKVLKDIISEEVTGPFDHSNLNLDRPEFANLNPTAENIARVAWQKIRKRLPDHMDLQIRLSETDNNFVEYPA